MSKFEELIFYPVTGWHIGPLNGHQAMVLQFGYTSASAHSDTQEFKSVFFGLTPGMTRKLINSLSQHLKLIEDDKVSPSSLN